MNEQINSIAQVVLAGDLIDKSQIESLNSFAQDDLWDMLYWANRIREKNFGNKVRLCSIVPGRLGGCNQDCKFCAQSASYDTPIKNTTTLSDDEILKAAEVAHDNNVPFLGIVYSGKAVTEKELQRLEKLIPEIISKYNIGICASLGIINDSQAKRLADAGVSRYNHNLETSERHFAEVVTTHTYASRVDTIRVALKAGMGVCGGGIFGIGETESDRIDMALELRDLGVDMVPMNFLHPIQGTPMADMEVMNPKEILRLIALYRFILPKAQIKVAGGRVLNLRDMQSWMFYAGATALLSGDYLTTAGRSVKQDMQMVKDLGMEVDLQR